jgi:hypothetical protein
MRCSYGGGRGAEDGFDGMEQRDLVYGLGKIGPRTESLYPLGVAGLVVPGDDNHRRVRRATRKRFEDSETVDARHMQIEQDAAERLNVWRAEQRRAVLEGYHAVAARAQQAAERGAHPGFVVHDGDDGWVFRHGRQE